MSFPKNSAFDDQRAREAREVDFPVRHVGRPNIVEIPVRELEAIVEDLRQIPFLNDVEDWKLQSDIEDQADRLASFLPG